ncbi:HNH endonuclease [Nesterenkonia alba]|uniref:HNH endonuclease n=1 Tax=Nesterenkonia alba TaxID=515814 RepID=UPI0003FA7197|nr:HNH endonuclease [Nesterenkonia alba]
MSVEYMDSAHCSGPQHSPSPHDRRASAEVRAEAKLRDPRTVVLQDLEHQKRQVEVRQVCWLLDYIEKTIAETVTRTHDDSTNGSAALRRAEEAAGRDAAIMYAAEALGVSEYRVSLIHGRGAFARNQLPQVWKAFLNGEIPLAKLLKIAGAGKKLTTTETSQLLDAQAAVQAPRLRSRELDTWLKRTVAQLEPDQHARRCAQEYAERRVSVVPAEDYEHMSWLMVLLPTIQAMQIRNRLHAVARSATQPVPHNPVIAAVQNTAAASPAGTAPTSTPAMGTTSHVHLSGTTNDTPGAPHSSHSTDPTPSPADANNAGLTGAARLPDHAGNTHAAKAQAPRGGMHAAGEAAVQEAITRTGVLADMSNFDSLQRHLAQLATRQRVETAQAHQLNITEASHHAILNSRTHPHQARTRPATGPHLKETRPEERGTATGEHNQRNGPSRRWETGNLPSSPHTGDQRNLGQRAADMAAAWLLNGTTETGMNVDAHIGVVVAAETLTGQSDQPALSRDGTAVIPAAGVRAMIADPAVKLTWHSLVSDGQEILQHHYHGRYPPQLLKEAIQFRDGTCQAPGCTVPAENCDIDHITPWAPTPQGGPTRADNLQALCRRHHRIKTLGWNLIPL